MSAVHTRLIQDLGGATEVARQLNKKLAGRGEYITRARVQMWKTPSRRIPPEFRPLIASLAVEAGVTVPQHFTMPGQ